MADTRYRCNKCGNLTRFNVITIIRQKAFHHFTVGGELNLEEVEVLSEQVEEVQCRWCQEEGKVEVIEVLKGE